MHVIQRDCDFSTLILLFTYTYLQPYQVQLLLMQTKHFLLLLVHIESIQLTEHGPFIVKQSQEIQCI